MTKYMVLRRNPDADEDLFTHPVSLTDPADVPVASKAATAELSDHDAADLCRDADVLDVVPVMPCTLVQPFSPSASDPPGSLWGLDAVGATACPQDGAGVTVAILDTGIDRQHEAFAGLTLGEANLKDFTVQEEGVAGSAEDVDGHGTHAAGTLFGRSVGGRRIGVAR